MNLKQSREVFLTMVHPDERDWSFRLRQAVLVDTPVRQKRILAEIRLSDEPSVVFCLPQEHREALSFLECYEKVATFDLKRYDRKDGLLRRDYVGVQMVNGFFFERSGEQLGAVHLDVPNAFVVHGPEDAVRFGTRVTLRVYEEWRKAFATAYLAMLDTIQTPIVYESFVEEKKL